MDEIRDMLEAGNIELLDGAANIRTFEEVGMLTNNEGLVVKLPDGTEYQITIIQSR